MRITIVALVALLLVAAVPAFAGGGAKGDWELGGYWGHAWLDDYGIFHPDDDNFFGFRFGRFFSNHWSLEASWQKLNTDTEPDVVGVADEELKIQSLRLNALYNFGHPGNGVRPFLTAGLGQEKTEITNFGESCDIGWNAGGGLRFFLSPKVNLRLDGRYVRTKVGDAIDESQGNVEASVGLGLLFGGGGKEAEVQAEPPPQPPANQSPTVSCAAARSEALPGESVNITTTASDPEGGPLTYAWSATGGRVTGTGATATLDFTGATPPSSATITVRVTDDHGLTATSDCSVRLIEPAKPAEAVSCTAGGFPLNLSRVGNIDKACLDDVAQRLSSDPRARVIVIGHADRRETAREIAQRRADATKDYLVKERGIDATRVTTRAAAPDTGADAAARAGNRRVEVWFVPEGAAEPR
jgi:outer membrane protein OmpA-like peptidoglycan-associated protein/opacity protein-like surface antigen